MPDTETSVHRFPQRLAIRVPMGLPRAVEMAATLQFTSPSEYLRRAVLHALRADGVHLNADGRVESHKSHRSAGKVLAERGLMRT